MTVKEFERSFLSIACKPKKTYMLSVFAKGSRIDDKKQILHNDHIGSELHMNPDILNKQVLKWWIQRNTIIVIVE